MGGHRVVPISEVGTLVSAAMAAIFAFVSEVFRNLRLFRKEVTGRVVGNLGKYAFRVTPFTAQNPFRISTHTSIIPRHCAIENRADP